MAAKLTDKQREEIIDYIRQGFTAEEIAIEYNVNPCTIYRVKTKAKQEGLLPNKRISGTYKKRSSSNGARKTVKKTESVSDSGTKVNPKKTVVSKASSVTDKTKRELSFSSSDVNFPTREKTDFRKSGEIPKKDPTFTYNVYFRDNPVPKQVTTYKTLQSINNTAVDRPFIVFGGVAIKMQDILYIELVARDGKPVTDEG